MRALKRAHNSHGAYKRACTRTHGCTIRHSVSRLVRLFEGEPLLRRRHPVRKHPCTTVSDTRAVRAHMRRSAQSARSHQYSRIPAATSVRTLKSRSPFVLHSTLCSSVLNENRPESVLGPHLRTQHRAKQQARSFSSVMGWLLRIELNDHHAVDLQPLQTRNHTQREQRLRETGTSSEQAARSAQKDLIRRADARGLVRLLLNDAKVNDEAREACTAQPCTAIRGPGLECAAGC